MTAAYRWFTTDLKIGSRLVIAFSVLIALGLTGAVVGSWRVLELQRLAARMANVDAELMVLAAQWETAIKVNAVGTDVILFAKDQEIVHQAKEAQKAVSAVQTQHNQRIKELIAGDEKAQSLVDSVFRQRKEFQDYRAALFQRQEAGEDIVAEAKARLKPFTAQYEASVEDFAAYTRQRLAANEADFEKNAAAGLQTLLASAGIAVVASIWLAWAIRRSLVKPVQEAVGAASAIAMGNLSHNIAAKGADELGQLSGAVGAMQDALRGIVANVRASSENIAAGTGEIAAGNADLSARTEEQAASLQQTAASIKQLTESVRGNAQAASEAAQLAKRANAVAGQGASAMKEVASSMQMISESSRKISEITGVIDSIAFQTNILALNAAVEAARAGAQGRGFAVVASEVRTLAQSSGEAAKAIKALIAQSALQVDSGGKKVSEAGRTMDDIVGHVDQVSTLVAGISAASAEQSVGIDEVNGAMGQLDTLTQQNASLVEESAAAAESLKQQSEQLVEAISIFRLEAADSARVASARVLATAAASARSEASAKLPRIEVRQVQLPATRPATAPFARDPAHPQDAGSWHEF